MRGAPTHCLECGREFVVTKYLDWVQIRCPKYHPGSRHEHWRFPMKKHIAKPATATEIRRSLRISKADIQAALRAIKRVLPKG